MLEIAGTIGLPPSEFWEMTIGEFNIFADARATQQIKECIFVGYYSAYYVAGKKPKPPNVLFKKMDRGKSSSGVSIERAKEMDRIISEGGGKPWQ